MKKWSITGAKLQQQFVKNMYILFVFVNKPKDLTNMKHNFYKKIASQFLNNFFKKLLKIS